MKTPVLSGIIAGAMALGGAASCPAQSTSTGFTSTIKEDAVSVGHAVAHGAQTVGHAVANESKVVAHKVAEKSTAFGHVVAKESKTVGHTVAAKSTETGHAIADTSTKVDGEVKSARSRLPSPAMYPSLRIRALRDDRDEQRAIVDLSANLTIPDIPTPELALIETHLDTRSTQGFTDPLCRFRVPRRVV